MTLALYGKSRRRQGLLGLLAMLVFALGIMLATTLPGPGGAGAVSTGQPDLTATKTNDVGGQATTGVAFNWTIEVRNDGDSNATFGNSKSILFDEVPAGVTIIGVPLGAFDGISGDGTIVCISQVATASAPARARCDTSASGSTSVIIAPGGYFEMVVNVTISPAETYDNPTGADRCIVDLTNQVAESREDNNTCSNTVVVTDPPTTGTIVLHKVILGSGGNNADEFSGNLNSNSTQVSWSGLSVNNSITKSGLAPGQWTVSENDPAGYDRKGFAVGTVDTCPAEPNANFVQPTVVAGGTDYICVYNETTPGSITIIKNSVPESEQDFTFSVTGQSPDRVLDDDGNDDNTNSSNTTYTLPPGAYDVTEKHPLADGWTLTSFSCTGSGNANITNGVKVDVSPGEKVTCTFTNTLSPKIIVIKVNPDGGANDSFVIDASNSTNSQFKAYTLAQGESDMDFMPADTYDVIERDPTNVGNGYLAPKYATVHNGGATCPTTPSTTNVTPKALVAGDVWLVCVFNTPATGDLRVIKVMLGGGDLNQMFAVTATSGQNQQGYTPSDNSPESHEVPVGTWTVEEADPTGLGYVRLGYALWIPNIESCPASPTQTTSIDVVVTTGRFAAVCVYNEPIVDGSLVIRKVILGTPVDTFGNFSGTVTGLSGFNSLSVNNPAVYQGISEDTYTVAESDPGPVYAITGYALGGITCPANPTQSGPIDAVVTAGRTTTVCIYNTPVPSRTIDICKVLLDNGDGVDNGSTFTFDVTAYANPVAVTFVPEDGTGGHCTTVSVPSDQEITITETGLRPSNWNGDASGYPQNSGAGTANGGSTRAVPAGTSAATVTFTNKSIPDPMIIVEKFNIDGTAGDVFSINVHTSTYSLSHGQSAETSVPAGTYSITEDDSTGIGTGYLAPQYALGACSQNGTPSSSISVTVAAGDVVTVCVTNTPADTPTWSKVAATYANGAAQWVIAIDNSGGSAIDRSVQVLEDDTIGLLPSGCIIIFGGVSCDVPVGQTRSFPVSRPVGQFCEASNVVNSATAAVYRGPSKLFGLPDQLDVSAVVPADTSLCGQPTISKTGNSYTLGDGVATWTITIDNNAAQATTQTVVISDDDDLVGSPPAACGNPSGDLPGSLDCTIAAGDTLVLTVQRAVTETCLGDLLSDTATATIGGQPIQGSPTNAAIVNIPANTALCDDPTIFKTGNSYTLGDGVATWNITIDNSSSGRSTERVVVISDDDALAGNLPAECGNPSGGLPGSLNCTIAAGATLVLTVQQAVTEACLGDSLTNIATATIGGQPIQGSPTGAATVTIPANPGFCDSTVAVTKLFDDNGNDLIDGSDSLVGFWGITLVCSGGISRSGVTATNGTIVFTVPGSDDGSARECIVTEATGSAANVVGVSLNGGALIGGASSVSFTSAGRDSTTVEFLNIPVTIIQSTPPPGGTPPPTAETETPTPTPETPEPEPTEPIVVETPTPQPDTPEAIEGATPIAPDTGSGLALTSGNGSAAGLMMIAVALFVLGGAFGAFSMARGRR